jgi:putative ABC transport system permease protein
VLDDLRFALRTVGRRPAFAAAVIGTLAIGIGATTAIFSFVDGVLLKPLPFSEPERLVALEESSPAQGKPHFVASPRNVEDWQRASRTVAELGMWRDWGFQLATPEGPRGISGGIASPSLFRLLGVQPAAGRLLLDEENVPGNDRVVLASYRFWQRELGGRPEAVGTLLPLRGDTFRLVGVLPPSFDTPNLGWMDLWAPLSIDPDQKLGRQLRNRRVYTRLAPGATLAQAQAELASVAAGLAQEYPDTNAGWTVRVTPLLEFEVGAAARATFGALAGAVIVLLLVACVNVAHLLLARAGASERELAVRLALGAGRGDVVRQVLALGTTLSLLGGALGGLLAWPAVRALVAAGPPGVPRLTGVTVDGRALVFTVAVALLTGVLFSAAPALRCGRIRVAAALRNAARASSGVDSRRLRAALVAGEVALTVTLLAAAGLLGRTVLRLASLDTGFDAGRLLTLQLFMPFESQYKDAGRRAALYRQAIASVAALPGVEAVGAASAAPNLGGGDGDLELAVEGRPAAPKGSNPTARYFDVSPGYFRALGIPLLRGRVFSDGDDLSSRRVALVNEAMARRFFPGEDPVGRSVRAVQWGDAYEVVGVVGDARAVALGSATAPEIYVPYLQGPRFATYLIVRSSAPPDGLEPAVRARIREIDPGVLVSNVAPLGSLIERELRAPRFRMLLVAAFALAAVALAAVGVFGVISYTTGRRTHEIGVRIAVGAGRGEVLRLVLVQGMRPVLAGAALGLAGAFAASRALRGLLFEVSPLDLPSFGGAVAVVLLVGVLACAIPARRAASLDPVAALRWE